MNTGSDSHSSDSDAWRSRSATDGMRNGDAGSSSLAAKGFRSVRPNLQDKKSPTPVPLPPPRRESYQITPTGIDPPSYASLTTLPNSLVSSALSLAQNVAGVTQKGSYTLSTHTRSSYSYTKRTTTSATSSSSSVGPPAPSDPDPSAQTNDSPLLNSSESPLPNSTSSSSTSNTTTSTGKSSGSSSNNAHSTQVQVRRVATLQLTPATAPDPPAHNTPAQQEPPSINTAPPTGPDPNPPSNTSHTQAPHPPPAPPRRNSTAVADPHSSETRKASLSIQMNPPKSSAEAPPAPEEPRTTPPIPPRPAGDVVGQMAMNGSSAHASSPPSVPQRPFSPPAYPPPPPTLSPAMMRVQQSRSSESSESVMRESVVMGETTVSSTVPIARFSEEEKKVSIVKAPHYEGIGPVDESGIPIAIRTTVDRPKDWYKTMFKQIHMVHKPDDDYPDAYNATYTIVNNDNYTAVHAHPPPRTHTYRPLAKPVVGDDSAPPLREPSPAPIPPPPPMPSLLQLRSRDFDRERDMQHDMNEYSPPDRKVDTRKYRAEPRSIFEYEPGKSSILEQERPSSLFISHADRAPERPSSAASDYRKRRKSEPTVSQQNATTDQNALQASAQAHQPSRASTLKKPSARSSPSSPSRAKAGEVSEMASPRSASVPLCPSPPPPPRDSRRSLCSRNSWQAHRQDAADTWSSTEDAPTPPTYTPSYTPSYTPTPPHPQPQPRLKSRSCDDLLSDGPGLHHHAGRGRGGSPGGRGRGGGSTPPAATRSESAGSLLCDGSVVSLDGGSGSASPRQPHQHHARRRRAHDAPGFLQLYKKMHHINRAELLPSEVIRSVRTRILELEKHQQQWGVPRLGGGGWAPWGGEVPRDMVPTRISAYEQMIQKSKSMPNLGDEAPSGATTPGSSSRASSSGGGCPKRRFSIESLLEEDTPTGPPPASSISASTTISPSSPPPPERRPRSPPEGQPRAGPSDGLPRQHRPPPLHPLPSTHTHHQHHHHHPLDRPRPASATPHQQGEYSDSEADAAASDLSDFVQVEASSFCSESDFDHCSLTSSESFYASAAGRHQFLHHLHHHHHHGHGHGHPHQSHQSLGQSQGFQHRHLISSCKGRCPASYTRFTTMRKHERERARLEPRTPSAAATPVNTPTHAHPSALSQPDPGLSKLAFLVSPVPFRRKKGSPPGGGGGGGGDCGGHRRGRSRPRSKTAMYEALDAALQDIYEHIRAERAGRGGGQSLREGVARLPDDSILRRLLEELLPDVPERSSSLKGRRGGHFGGHHSAGPSPTPPSSHHRYHHHHQQQQQQPYHHHHQASRSQQGSPSGYASPCGLGSDLSASPHRHHHQYHLADASNNNHHHANANAHCYTGGGGMTYISPHPPYTHLHAHTHICPPGG